jgi:cellulose biosynthesis protein BcsQ
MKTIAFFNNRGGVGQTSLVYHLAWMFSDLGVPVLAADLDPQANLTAMFLDKEQLQSLWPEDDDHGSTVYGAIRPILLGTGDITVPPVNWVGRDLGLLPGDLSLSRFEDSLSNAWLRGSHADESSLRTTTAFRRLLEEMSKGWAKLILIDVGPNLGAINRAALAACDRVCLPLVPDLYSVQALKNVGAALAKWRREWLAFDGSALAPEMMSPCGYVVTKHVRPNPMRRNPLSDRLPSMYRSYVLDEPILESPPKPTDDPNCLALLRNFPSLMSLAIEAHKPMFELKPADGAIGAHAEAVRQCKADFLRLATAIAASVGLPMPSATI